MKIKASAFTICTTALLLTGLAGCVGNLVNKVGNNAPITTTITGSSSATTLDSYKRDLAQRIVEVNSTSVFVGHPQALLRAVIVLKYYVDADGKLLRAEILRSNKDRAAEAVALSAVKSAAPFPKPDSHLLRKGQVEISESWLFNNDGRFQLRSLAEAQLGE